MNSDLIELLVIFNDGHVKYLIVGGAAFIHHAEPRYTKDIDIWVDPDPANAQRVFDCLTRFGAPLTSVTAADFTNEDIFYQMGRSPNRVDILVSVSGLTFDEAWDRRTTADVEGVPVPMLSREDLITSKLAAGRPQDLVDVATLRKPVRPASDFAPKRSRTPRK